MSWMTVVWSMIASACLTLGAIYGLAWSKSRTDWSHLFFAATAIATAAFTFCELGLMQAETPEALLTSFKWGHVALLFWIVSIIWFVRLHLGAGRIWLAVTICVLRACYLAPTLLVGPSFLYREITSLRRVPLLGEQVTIFTVITSPWMLIGQVINFMIIVFVADASITAWRRGERRKALIVGGGIEFFVILSLLDSGLVYWAQLPIPILLSPFYLGMVALMGSEVSRDVLRAPLLVHKLQASEAELRESEQRMSLAVDAADFGLLIRDFARNEIWASEKWRELFGYAPSEALEYGAILSRVHPDDREALEHALALAFAGADGGKYRIEYRILLPGGTTRWIASQGSVEHDATGKPVLTRGAARDITVHKHAEGVVRNLSGRLLTAQEEERRRIARELHDNLSQQLALLAIQIGELSLKPEVPVAAESMQRLGERTAEISKEVHGLSHRLHSTKLDTLGLQAAVQGHCRELRARDLRVQCQAENVPDGLPYDVSLCLFRIVQEGLNNVVKHSGAHEAEVTLVGARDGLRLTIADAGRGFDATAAAAHDGLGLASMRERVNLVGGQLSLKSEPGRGATISVHVPIAGGGGPAAGSPRVA